VGGYLFMAHAQKLNIRTTLEGVEDFDITRADDAEDIAHSFEA
jgi:hypothetical protein